MAAPLAHEPDDAVRAARLALLQQYVQATDETQRDEVLGRLVGSVPPEERAAARTRLLDWLAAPAPAGLETNEAYTDLLLQALSGTLRAGSAAEMAFREWVAGGDTEYREVQRALAAGPATWAHMAVPPGAFPAFDLTFLRAGDLWTAGLTWALEIAAAEGRARVRIPFTAAARSPAEAAGWATAGAPVGATRDLLVVALGPAPAHGLPGRYQLAVQAQRVAATTCRLLVNVRGRGLRRRSGEIRVTLERRAGPSLEATANPQGTATFEALPIGDLDGLTVMISLPTAPASGAVGT